MAASPSARTIAAKEREKEREGLKNLWPLAHVSRPRSRQRARNRTVCLQTVKIATNVRVSLNGCGCCKFTNIKKNVKKVIV